ncbi:MAG: ABC transporter ATP-binding protein, partial [Actinobacteria bacterium]|nr:ABC transporter ATP-binding protein [Actinomycetota bacterium]
VALTIGLNLILSLTKSALARWAAYCDTTSWTSMHKVFTDKLLSMDYIDIENPDTQQKFSEIRQHQNGMGFGLRRLLIAYDRIIAGLVQIALSVSLAMSLFTLRVPPASPLSYLDSPLAMMLFAIALLCSIVVAPYLSMVGGKIWGRASHDNNVANRLFHFYFYQLTRDAHRAKDIRIYGQQPLIERGASWGNQIGHWLEYARYDARFSAASTAVSYLSNGMVYLYVALKALAGAFGVGGIVQYVGAITQFGSGFATTLTNVGMLVNNNVFLDKAFAFLDTPNLMQQGALHVDRRRGATYTIEFRNVSFRYPGTDTYALKNLNLTLDTGRRMAVVGMNGSGKTTMIKLLCRLYDPTEGTITLNGIDIRQYDYDAYLALFSIVFQDFRLLPLTLGQNVAASAEVDVDRARRVLWQSGLGPRLENMPRGLETPLYREMEDDGIEVSGGEAQKTALARALYRDAPFVVLDEPTAALDPIAEYEIYSRFDEIVGDKTAVYISHRLSSCRFCDDIAVFHEGELVQRGSHEALLTDERGKYYELWNAQAQYYATETA